jgi:hypothetical protein
MQESVFREGIAWDEIRRNRMQGIRTVAIDRDRDHDFLAACAAIDQLMAPYGHPPDLQRGSSGWRGGRGLPSRRFEILYKCLFLGPGQPWIFGIRRDHADSNPALRGISWTREFWVMPQRHAEFVGFAVRAGDLDTLLRRVRAILEKVGPPNRAAALPPEDAEREAELDRQLESERE